MFIGGGTMSVLTENLIKEKLLLIKEDPEKALVISPILDPTQFNPSSIDLRLGMEFKVSIPTRAPLIGTVSDPLENFFQDTYRNFGEEFILHPNQLVLVNTFEYIKLPSNLMGMLTARSSLNRLGINISAIIHPGYAGTLTLQLENNGINAISLICGMRLVQLTLFTTENNEMSYLTNSYAKYVGNTSPVLSQINQDQDLHVLKKF